MDWERGTSNTTLLNNDRELPTHIKEIIDSLPTEISLMDAMRTAISALCP